MGGQLHVGQRRLPTRRRHPGSSLRAARLPRVRLDAVWPAAVQRPVRHARPAAAAAQGVYHEGAGFEHWFAVRPLACQDTNDNGGADPFSGTNVDDNGFHCNRGSEPAPIGEALPSATPTRRRARSRGPWRRRTEQKTLPIAQATMPSTTRRPSTRRGSFGTTASTIAASSRPNNLNSFRYLYSFGHISVVDDRRRTCRASPMAATSTCSRLASR